jgi:hypothetical protein
MLISLLAVSCALVSGVGASSALASGHCPGGWDACAWADANWEGGYIYQPGTYEFAVPDYTKTGVSSYPGCTHTQFNDCVSSIDNNGPYTGYYYWNAFCEGSIYTNNSGTGTNFIGSFWNDTFSSSSIGRTGLC